MDLEVHGRVEIQGDVDLVLQVAGYTSPGPGSLNETFYLEHGTYQRWQVNMIRYRHENHWALAPWNVSFASPAYPIEEGPIHGPLYLHGTLEEADFVNLGFPGDRATDLVGRHAFTVSAPNAARQPVLEAFYPSIARGLDVSGALLPSGVQAWAAGGEAVLTVFGPTVTNGDRVFETGTHRLASPDGPDQVIIETAEVLVIKGTFKETAVDSIWQPVLRGLNGTLDGDIAFYHNRARGEVNGTGMPERQRLTQAIGSLQLDAALDETPTNWSVQGETTFLAIDAQDWIGTRTSLGFIAAGAAGILWWLLWGGYNRLTQKRLVEHPIRKEILRLVAEHGQVRQHVLVLMLPGITRPRLRHHVDLLLKHGILIRNGLGKQGATQWLMLRVAPAESEAEAQSRRGCLD